MKEPDHRFLWYLCKTFNKFPDDPEIEDMDPVMKVYMFNHWLEDANEEVELFKNHGYLIGSFTNPEAVKNILGGNSYTVSEDEFEETSQMVAAAIRQERAERVTTNKKRRRRRKTSIQE